MSFYIRDHLDVVILSILDTDSSHHLHFSEKHWKQGEISKLIAAYDQKEYVSMQIGPQLNLFTGEWKNGVWSVWIRIDYCAYIGRFNLTEDVKIALIEVDRRLVHKHESK